MSTGFFGAGGKHVKTGPVPSVNESMGIRLAVSAYIGLAVYCLLSLLLGPMGMAAYDDLETRVRGMRENLARLESLNSEARARKDSALSDPEALALEARTLGYVAPGQVVVRLGFPEASPDPGDLGTLVPFAPPRGMEDAELKAASLAAALVAAFAGFLIRSDRRGSRQRRGPEGRVSPAGTAAARGL